MRDMLERLQTISEEKGDDPELEFWGPKYEDEDDVSLSQEAVVFEKTSPMDCILTEAHSIRKEVSLLKLEVERLCAHNERFGTSVRRLTLLKKHCDSIARAVQQRAEALYARLQAFGRDSKELEEKEGPHSAISRIARVQYDTLTRTFHAVMNDYNKAEEMQRTICRDRIQRQASILGAEITDDQLDLMVGKGGEGWAELTQSLQTQGARSSRWALCEIKGRHKELVELEARMKEIHDLFLQMAILVEEQASTINNIEANVNVTQDYVEKTNEDIKRALQYKRKNPCLQCCPCISWCRRPGPF